MEDGSGKKQDSRNKIQETRFKREGKRYILMLDFILVQVKHTLINIYFQCLGCIFEQQQQAKQ